MKAGKHGIMPVCQSISTHTPDEAPGMHFFHPDGVNRPSRAPRSSFSPGSGPSSIRRAQAIPGLSGRARGLRTKETRAKSRGKFPRVPAGRVAPTCRREWAVVVLIVSSSAHHLPRTHRLLRAVKAATDGRLMTHKYRGCIVVLSINQSVEPNEEQNMLMSGFDQGITINTSKQVFRGIW
jgi:hypothetical protein